MSAEHKAKRLVCAPGVAVANGAEFAVLVDLADIVPVLLVVKGLLAILRLGAVGVVGGCLLYTSDAADEMD